MKKLLLASSILAATAGVAAAEVAVSGSARMGVTYDSISGDAVFSSRVRIAFTATGETDGGLAFGASMRADQNGGNADGTDNGDSTVFISGSFGKLTMGDVGGAADALVGQTSGVGYGPNDGLHEIGFVGTDKTAAYYEYSAGSLTFGLGLGQTNGGNEKSVGVKYVMGDYAFAIGYEDGSRSQLSASASAKFGSTTLKARVSNSDAVGFGTAYSVSADFVTGATTITGFYTDFGDSDIQHAGIGAAYDLGGGATFAAGLVQQMGAADETFADAGVKFSF
jgi:outer membrane protein OmpU